MIECGEAGELFAVLSLGDQPPVMSELSPYHDERSEALGKLAALFSGRSPFEAVSVGPESGSQLFG